jgi:hypothetical protein
MAFFKPLPRAVTRPLSILVLVAWGAVMAVLIHRLYRSSATLATDLGRYTSAAVWHGVYYRGEKIGFTVGQTVKTDEGFELQEDGRLQMSLLGATTPVTIRTTARVDRDFQLQSFSFSLDPGTGPIDVRGQLDGTRLNLAITSAGRTRTEVRDLAERPALSLNLSRRLANGGLVTGARHRWTVFDAATLHNAPIVVDVGRRELVRGSGTAPIPAFRVETEFSGLRTTSWVTDTGEVVREESPLGLLTIRESPENARAMAVPAQVQADLLEAAAIVPAGRERIDDPRDVLRLRLRLEGADLSNLDLADSSGIQTLSGNVLELRDPRGILATTADPDLQRYLAPEPLIESDDPEIRAEAATAVREATAPRERAERITRYVNGLLEKKPTVSIPSAREVLRTRVGDCNEHTALFVAMARAAGIPSRVAVGLVFIRGAFYYHAWPEVYVADGSRGYWLPVDPTLNQFPADATHVRLARGGLDRQTAILPLVGRLKMTVLDVETAPESTRPILAAAPADLGPLATPIPQRSSRCACSR